MLARTGSRRHSHIGRVALLSGGSSRSFIELGCVFSYGNIVELGDAGTSDSALGPGSVVERGGAVGKVQIAVVDSALGLNRFAGTGRIVDPSTVIHHGGAIDIEDAVEGRVHDDSDGKHRGSESVWVIWLGEIWRER